MVERRIEDGGQSVGDTGRRQKREVRKGDRRED
jgi:hypothetical protein